MKKFNFEKFNLNSEKNILAFAIALLLIFGFYKFVDSNLLRNTNFDFINNQETAINEDISATSTVRDINDDRLVSERENLNSNMLWVANDYSKGDILSGNYTVVSGDTLWEIAEGAYGDGSLWTQILDANSESVDFLPNGQQALIYPGQILIIQVLQ
mgnify:CR=1 FL=1